MCLYSNPPTHTHKTKSTHMHTKRALPCIQTPHLAAFGSVLRLLSHRSGNPAAGVFMWSSEGGASLLSEGECFCLEQNLDVPKVIKVVLGFVCF